MAITVEHVPPQCLFPEKKDVQTNRFRTNLITVPSCIEHNLAKSKDDEFLMICLAICVGNNEIGYIHAHTKVKRALDRQIIERKNSDFVQKIIREPKKFTLEFQGKIFPIMLGRPDSERLTRCFDHIARGLYYWKFKDQFEGECIVHIDFLIPDDPNMVKYWALAKKQFDIDAKKSKTEGSNPEIFSYIFLEPDNYGNVMLKMTFYEGAKVSVVFKKKDSDRPYNLVLDWILSGVKVSVQSDDGEQIDFN